MFFEAYSRCAGRSLVPDDEPGRERTMIRGCAVAWSVATLFFASPALAGTLTVLSTADSGSGSLRDAIGHANSGDMIAFAAALDGQTITLTSGEIVIKDSIDIEGPGAGLLSISGNDRSRVFNLAEGISVTIAGLTITHGQAAGSHGGGAILDVGSTLSLANDVFSDNAVLGSSKATWTRGGAISIWAGATLVASDSQFIANKAVAAPGGSAAEGGAISSSDDSSATLRGCVFRSNQALGGDGGLVNGNHSGIGGAIGGAIQSDGSGSAYLTIVDSLFSDNQAMGGSGGSGGAGGSFYYVGIIEGGAITNHGGSTLFVSGSTFSNNGGIAGSNAVGGASGVGVVAVAYGGAIENLGTATIVDSAFDHNQAIGGSGNGGGAGFLYFGQGIGGAIANFAFGGPGTLTMSNVSFIDNQAAGGSNNATGYPWSGDGIGGAVTSWLGGSASISDSSFSGNQAIGGAGFDGLGGAVANWLGSTITMNDCTITAALAFGGAGGGSGLGGGIWNDGVSTNPFSGLPVAASISILGSTVTSSQASTGGGAYLTSGGSACADSSTVIGANQPDNVFGVLSSCL
jgi:hypothetical protein